MSEKMSDTEVGCFTNGCFTKVQQVLGNETCKNCNGEKLVKGAAGQSLPCPVCRGSGKDALITK